MRLVQREARERVAIPSAARRRVVYAVLVTVVAALLIPVVTDRDSFPLSDYPMFSTRRTPTERIDTAFAVDPDGTRHTLSPELIGGSDEPILAAATVINAIAGGRAGGLCSDIARRVARSGARRLRTADAVVVVSERYDATRYFEGDTTPVESIVQARCPVVR